MAKGGSWAAHVRLCLVALVVTVIAWPALAVLDCESVKPSESMACLERNLREADGLIDKTYQAARARLDEAGKIRLLAEQRAWMEKRNRMCGVTSGQGDREAWLRDILKDGFKTACVGGITIARINELNRYGLPAAPETVIAGTAPETPKVPQPPAPDPKPEETAAPQSPAPAAEAAPESAEPSFVFDAQSVIVAGLVLGAALAFTVLGGSWGLPVSVIVLGALRFVLVGGWWETAALVVALALYLAIMKATLEALQPSPDAKAFAKAMPGLAVGSFPLLFVLMVLGNLVTSGRLRFLQSLADSAGIAGVLLVLGLAAALVLHLAKRMRLARLTAGRPKARAGSPRRYRWFKAVVVTVWALFVAFLLWQTANDVRQLASIEKPQELSAGINPNMEPYARAQVEARREYLARQYTVALQQPLDNLALNVWALIAAAALAFIGVNPLGWIGGRRLIWGGIAFAVCLGRPSQGLLAHYALAYIERGLLVDLALWIVVNPFLMFLSGSAIISLVFIGITIFFSLLVGVPMTVLAHILQFERDLFLYRYHRQGFAARIVRFAYWLAGETMPAPSPDESRGARFAIPAEVNKLYNPKGMAFGHVGGSPLLIHTEKHVLIMGGTRSGKGVSLIVPHLLRYRGSAFVLDPKGENARATGRHRASINDVVHYLDPFGISGKPRSRFNPLSRFTPENMEAESKALAAALVLTHDNRDHWTAAGQQLLAAIILHVVTSDTIPPESRDLPTARRLLLGNIRTLLDEMARSEAAGGLVSDLAGSFQNTPEKEFGSIVSTAQRETEILDNPFIVACLSASGPGEEVDFKAWRTGTMTVYLCLSAPKFPVFNRWLRLVLTSALDEMTDTLAPPPLPVCFMLDELATLGHLQPVENAVGLAAGYGIQLVTVFQDVPQMRDLYKGRWASFINNAGVRALFALDDYDTASYWSKFIGSHIVSTTSQQQDIYGLTSGQNVGETVRPLLAPEQIMQRYAAGPEGTGRMLVLPEGSRPVETDKVPYFDDTALKGLWDKPRSNVK